MPKVEGPVWKHFKKSTVKQGGKELTKYICSYCNFCYNFKNASKKENHLAKNCKSAPNVVVLEFQERAKGTSSGHCHEDEDEQQEDDVVERSSSAPPTPTTSRNFASPPAKKRRSLDGYVVQMTSSQQAKADEKFARAVYSGQLPFSIFDNNLFWQDAITAINPCYKLPSFHQLRTPLLVAEYDRVMNASREKIEKTETVTIVSDGWKNIKGHKLINFIVCTPEPVFLKSIEPGENNENAKYVGKQLIEAVEEVGSEKVSAILTDNCNNMKAAWNIVNKKYPHILCIGCSAHGFNLLAKDIMRLPTFKELVDQAKVVINIRNCSVILAVFEKNQQRRYGKSAKSLKVPNPTRFSGFLIVLECVESNREALQETVLTENLEVDERVKTIVLSHSFWKKVKHAKELLKTIAQAILVAESDSARISIVPRLLMDVKQRITVSLSKTALTEVEMQTVMKTLRFRLRFISYNAHIAAYILDPRFRGEGLSDSEITDGLDVIKILAQHLDLNVAKVTANVINFRTQSDFFQNRVIWESVKDLDPIVWWKGLCNGQPAAPVARILLNIVPSSASSERNWKVFTDAQTRKRNRLHNKTSEKLVAVKSNLILTYPNHFKKQKERRCTGDVQYYLTVQPTCLYSQYDYDEEDNLPLNQIQNKTALQNYWQEAEAYAIDRDWDESDFDSGEDSDVDSDLSMPDGVNYSDSDDDVEESDYIHSSSSDNGNDA